MADAALVPPPRAVRVEARGLVLEALQLGAPGPRQVLALHGWLDNAHSFVPMAPELAGCDLRALELPGHGHSQHRPACAGYHILNYLPDVICALDAWGWRRCHLVGHSLGGFVAAAVAAAWPERVASVVLIDGVGPPGLATCQLPAQLARHLADDRRLARRARRHYPSVPAMAGQLCKVVPGLPPPAAQLLAERGSEPVAAGAEGEGGVLARADPRLRARSLLILAEAEVRSLLAAVAAPTLLVRARPGSGPAGPELAGRLAAMATLEQVVLEGGHHLHMEAPRAVARAMMGFWRRCAAAERGEA